MAGVDQIFSLADVVARYLRACGKRSILECKPLQGKINIEGLKFTPMTIGDTVSFSNKRLQQINQKADEILTEIRRIFHADYIEQRCPDIVADVKAGKIEYQDALNYLNYKRLEEFRHDAPEALILFGAEKGSAFDLQTMISEYGDLPIKTIKKMSLSDIRKTLAEVDDLAKKNEFSPEIEHYINMLIMKKYNPKSYEYLMSKDPILVERWGANFGETPSVTMLQNITPQQCQVMRRDKLPSMKHIGHYVESSDDFVRNKRAVEELSESLSKCKLSTDINLYRGDKTVGMFDSVDIDKNFEKQIRQLLETFKEQAQRTSITEYTGRYNCGPTTNLYEFLSKKETLTLADAMQVVKYGDDTFLEEIIRRIQEARIIDKRFKSYSFDKGMAAGWRGINSGDNTTIVQNAIIKKGTQGGFHCGNNAQYEVVLNNTPKEMTFDTVIYDRLTDTFNIGLTVQNI